MQISALARRLLHVLLALGSASSAVTRPRLERRLAVPARDLTPVIDELVRLGLLDGPRLRLTMPGLAVAVACRAGATRQRPTQARPEPHPPQLAMDAPIALFSQRESPRAVA